MSNLEQNISDAILKTIDVVVDKKISELNYSQTIKATIIEDSRASNGVYTVKYETSEFLAYTTDTSLKTGDLVQILISSNDSTEERTILNKIAISEDERIPNGDYLKYFDVTGNLTEIILDTNRKLLANGDIAENLLWSTTTTHDFSNYTKVNLEASFQSFLPNANKGTYGVRLEITHDDVILNLYFTNDEMLGNSLNYDGYNTQRKIFDLKNFNIEEITNIALYFYQEKGTFIDSNGNTIAAKDSFGYNLSPNLFINDVKLSFGFFKDELTPGVDQVYIFPAPGYKLSYDDVEPDNAIVQLRWLHWNDDNTELLTKEQILADDRFRIEWYQYQLYEEAIDTIKKQRENHLEAFSGLYGEEQLDLIENNLIKQLGCSYINNDNWQHLSNSDNSFSCSVNLDGDKQTQEQIRAFVFFTGEDNVFESNILTFEGTYPHKDTKKQGLYLTALDGTQGQYYLYKQDGILNHEDKKTRIIKAHYYTPDGVEVDLINNENYSIKWSGPESENSMLLHCQQGTNPTEFTYTIAKEFKPTAINNTISCIVTFDNASFSYNEYLAELKCEFGYANYNNTETNLIIDFVDDSLMDGNVHYAKNAVQASDEHQEESFVLKQFDTQYKRIDLSEKTITWNLIVYKNYADKIVINASDGTFFIEGYSLNKNQQTKDIITVIAESGFNFTDYLILQATIDNWTIEFSIPVSADPFNYNYLRGATYVIYPQLGIPIYDKEPYTIYDHNGNEITEDIEWEYQKDTWYEISNGTKPLLIPSQVYLDSHEGVGIICKKKIDENLSEPIFLQPINISESAFFSKTLSKWDGKSVSIQDNSIAAPMIAAGKKENNLFTGVIMGDWQADASIALTGLYGFKKGKSAFGFTEEGNGFIGQAGKGRIQFNGEHGWITSGDFIKVDNNLYKTTSFIDLTAEGIGVLDSAFVEVQIDQDAFNINKTNFYIIDDINYMTESLQYIQCTNNDQFNENQRYFIKRTGMAYNDIIVKFGDNFRLSKQGILSLGHGTLGSIIFDGNRSLIASGDFGLINNQNYYDGTSWIDLTTNGIPVDNNEPQKKLMVKFGSKFYIENNGDVYTKGKIVAESLHLEVPNSGTPSQQVEFFDYVIPQTERYLKYKDLYPGKDPQTNEDLSENILSYWVKDGVAYYWDGEDNGMKSLPSQPTPQFINSLTTEKITNTEVFGEEINRYIVDSVRVVTKISSKYTYVDEYDNYIETNVGGGKFRVSTNGLLRANNAIINGTIYTNAGRIGGNLVIGSEGNAKGKTPDQLLNDIEPHTYRYTKYKNLITDQPIEYWIGEDENNTIQAFNWSEVNQTMTVISNPLPSVNDVLNKKIYISTENEYKEYPSGYSFSNQPSDFAYQQNQYVKVYDRVITTLNNIPSYVDEYEDHIETNVGGGSYSVSTNGLLRANNAVINGTIYATKGRIGDSVVIGTESNGQAKTVNTLLIDLIPETIRYTKYKDLYTNLPLDYWVVKNNNNYNAYDWENEINGMVAPNPYPSSIPNFDNEIIYLDKTHKYQIEEPVSYEELETRNRYVKYSDRVVTKLNGKYTYVDEYEDHIETNVGRGNFVISTNGLLRANNAVINGTIYSSRGAISSFRIANDWLYSIPEDNNTSIFLGARGLFLGTPQIIDNNQIRYDASQAPFYVLPNGSFKAIKGNIGGWNISNKGFSFEAEDALSIVDLTSSSYDPEQNEYFVYESNNNNELTLKKVNSTDPFDINETYYQKTFNSYVLNTEINNNNTIAKFGENFYILQDGSAVFKNKAYLIGDLLINGRIKGLYQIIRIQKKYTLKGSKVKKVLTGQLKINGSYLNETDYVAVGITGISTGNTRIKLCKFMISKVGNWSIAVSRSGENPVKKATLTFRVLLLKSDQTTELVFNEENDSEMYTEVSITEQDYEPNKYYIKTNVNGEDHYELSTGPFNANETYYIIEDETDEEEVTETNDSINGEQLHFPVFNLGNDQFYYNESNVNIAVEQVYVEVELTAQTYIPNKYYIWNNNTNQYEISTDSFNENQIYYQVENQLI